MAVSEATRAGSGTPPHGHPGRPGRDDRYKWVALSNTTLGVLMATIDLSIMLIALPDIFRGINLTPLTPGNSFYLLWMILSFMVVTSVLVVSLGRLGDMYGRVKMYNLGFAVYTFFSLLLDRHLDERARPAPSGLVVMRIFQGVGRGLPHRQLVGHPHRRLPREPAGDGARHQPGGRHQRLVHRPRARRPARADQLAPHLPGLGAGRARSAPSGPT